LLINSALDGNTACYVGFDHLGNNLYLLNDQSTQLTGPVKPAKGAVPGTGVVENSQCRVTGATSLAVDSGATLTLTIGIEFKAAFAGRKILYAATQTTTGGNSGWQPLGAWTVTSGTP
jgi:hypothetical protein